jgi:hypothetical protein
MQIDKTIIEQVHAQSSAKDVERAARDMYVYALSVARSVRRAHLKDTDKAERARFDLDQRAQDIAGVYTEPKSLLRKAYYYAKMKKPVVCAVYVRAYVKSIRES